MTETMGLDTTHNAWHGPYSTFGEWRRRIAVAAGYPVGDDWGYIIFNHPLPL